MGEPVTCAGCGADIAYSVRVRRDGAAWCVPCDGKRQGRTPIVAACVECGQPEWGQWVKSAADAMIERGECFECNFWLGKIRDIGDPTWVRVNGRCFRIAEEAAPGSFRGFGGARYIIRFNDGRLATTTNLWTQGVIPERFRERLPDNAVFEPAASRAAGRAE